MASTTRQVFATRTNTLHASGLPQRKLTSFLCPSSEQNPKRRREAEDKQTSKRVKVAEPSESESEETEGEYSDVDDVDVLMEDGLVTRARARPSMPCNLLTRRFAAVSVHPRKHARVSPLVYTFFFFD